jgi:hypothetical protein
MFEKLKNALGWGESRKTHAANAAVAPNAQPVQPGEVSQWASTQGLNFSHRSDGRGGYHLDGMVGNKPWKIEQGKSSRDFIKGLELRGRAELGIRESVSVMVISRKLKNDLDKRAFAQYTDTLQTIAEPNLPEEMRWLSIYEEVGWESLGQDFLDNYAILADHRTHAMSWVTQELVDRLMAWPTPNPEIPKILMLLRGKAYLRMQHTKGDLPTLDHATGVFTTACELALSRFVTDIEL